MLGHKSKRKWCHNFEYRRVVVSSGSKVTVVEETNDEMMESQMLVRDHKESPSFNSWRNHGRYRGNGTAAL
ncbi:hypothetical protein E2542_SST22467 [Spatholobus suberectus]|nr:hypothetical protein E2542_SST22467 [Spatholobus suberectus]